MLAYQTAVAELYHLGHELHKTASYKFNLKHMGVLGEALDSPHTSFPSVLIAGTNGKGSTAATLASILRTAGYRTGLYTSPHLVRINERIRINGDTISDADFADGYECVHTVAAGLVASGRLPWHPSFFETMTALAFRYFEQQRAEFVVAEVGMGGRLDATNILEPLVGVITDIDLDHQKFLGNTIREIAGEKAGIMRRGRPLVTLPQHPEANEALGRAMEETGAIGVNAARYVAAVFHPSAHAPSACEPGTGDGLPSGSHPTSFAAGDPGSRRASELVHHQWGHTVFAMDIMGEEVEIRTPLLGRHQLRNLALAISAAEELVKQGFAISPRQVAEGIRVTRWPGRFQIVPPEADGSRPEMVIDVAHNPAGAWALRAGLSEHFAAASIPVERKLIMVYGAMRDKAIRDVSRILFPLAEKVVLTRAGGNPRAATTIELVEAVGDCGTPLLETPNVAEAVRQAMVEAQPFGSRALLVITGSICVVGEAMQALGVRP